MKRCWASTRLTIFILLLVSLGGTAACASPRVKIIRHKSTLDVKIGGKLFVTYHFADNFVLPFVRPFFWPVLASDGTAVTIDQAQHPPLHPYQRSMWIGHGDVNGADHWKFSAKPFPPKQLHVKFDFVRRDRFREELIWQDAAGRPMLHETRTVHFLAYPDGARAVDLEIRFSPVSGDVDFANHKDHGLFSIRPDPEIAHDPTFTSSRGSNECAQPSAWCDESGRIGRRIYGIAVFDDPRNPRHPPMWHAHKDARLATDIFVLPDAAENHLPRTAGDFIIRKGTTATFHYRAVIHEGDARTADIAAKYAQFAASCEAGAANAGPSYGAH